CELLISQILSVITPVAVSRSNVSSRACSGSLKPEILTSGKFAFDKSSFIECSRSFKRAGVCKVGYSRRNCSGLRYLSIVTERCSPEDWLDLYSRDVVRDSISCFRSKNARLTSSTDASSSRVVTSPIGFPDTTACTTRRIILALQDRKSTRLNSSHLVISY